MMYMESPKIRDSQRSAVYSWERNNIAHFDVKPVPFNQVQAIIDYVWAQEGLEYPPQAELLPKNATGRAGDATRTKVRFRESTYTWIILHELAHSLTSNIEYESNHHGSLFMGMYIQLLNRFLKIPYDVMRDSAEASGLEVKPDAKPIFI
jgi:hypothetical protein